MKRLQTSMLALTLAVGTSSAAFAAQTSTHAKAKKSAMKASSHRTNPFFKPSRLPFHAPPFNRIQDSDYQPAIEAGMKAQLKEIEAIADDPKPATFRNTIVAMERSGELLERVSRVFFGVAQADSNPTLQKVEQIEAPKLAAHHDAIYLNAKLFARVKAIYAERAKLHVGKEGQTLIARYYQDFVRAGAELSDADKSKLRALNQEESKLTTEFKDKLLAATKDAALVVDDVSALDGLSKGDIAAAALAAKARKLTGKWVLPLQNTTQQPAQANLKNRATRKALFEASVHRADHGPNDTRPIVRRLAQLRAEKAKLLGYSTYAAYRLANQMAKTPEAAEKLLTGMVPATMAKARGEMARMQKLVDQQKGGFQLKAWDWQYYAEQLRKAEYSLDESKIRPYFELNHVLKDGVFYAAHALYGITFRERHDLPVYNPDVRVFEVYDANKKPLALFYADYFKRDNKGGGAWMDVFVHPSKLLHQKPVVYNVCNFTKPAPGHPALLTFDDVTTMFHEFGHALHGMFSAARYPTLSGTNVPRDFVEFPSQFNEHWALYPKVFRHYAKNYETGAPMPKALVEKIRAASKFNMGFATLEYLEASLVDLAWHTQAPGAPKPKVAPFETAALKKFGVWLPQVPPRYHTTYFAHIWEEGYQAGYYAYLWSEVLDDDAYDWFETHGGLTRANGNRFRRMILSRGHTEDLGKLYRAFRGRDPSVDALLEDRGLKTLPKKK